MTLAEAINRWPAMFVWALTLGASCVSMSFICLALQKTGVAGSPAAAPPRGAWANKTREPINSATITMPTDERMGTSMNHRNADILNYRCETGTHFKSGGGPIYSARGRIRRLLEYCSRMCAVQPDMRLTAKNGVNRSIGMPIT